MESHERSHGVLRVRTKMVAVPGYAPDAGRHWQLSERENVKAGWKMEWKMERPAEGIQKRENVRAWSVEDGRWEMGDGD